MHSRRIVLALVGSVVLGACGVTGAVTGMIRKAADRQVGSELSTFPEQACSFSATDKALRSAVRNAMEHNGYEIASVGEEGAVLTAKPSAVSQGPRIGGEESFRLEILTARVVTHDGSNVVLITMEKGLSRADDHWQMDNAPFDADDDDYVGFEDSEIVRDRSLYTPLMADVAASVGEPACTER
jgi:hypothetical protein